MQPYNLLQCMIHDHFISCYVTMIDFTWFWVVYKNYVLDGYLSEHAEKYGYGVVERFVGHGVGTVFHSKPIIYHHRKWSIDFSILLTTLLA